MSTAADILEAIHVQFRARLEGIVGGILDYEPAAIQKAPLMYSLLDEVDQTVTGMARGRRYRFMHRLVVVWVDNRQAEATILRYVDAIPAAIDADPSLGGVLGSGIARIVDQRAGWVTIGGALYRVLDSFSDTLDKRRFGT